MAKPKLQLPEVTICAADSAFVDFTARALSRSLDQVEFGDAILFSDLPREGAFRNVKIPPLTSIPAYSHFCLRTMADHIKTPYVLVIQWDGYVVNPDAWARAFLKYDYIGAAWHGLFPPEMMVGNGGFSLRSRKLLKAVQKLPPGGDYLEDRVICHVHRPALERQFGIRFAPVKIADRFSYEFKIPEAAPFGFHGAYHMWRHVNDADLLKIAGAIEISKTNPHHIMRLILNCVKNERVEAGRAFYRRVREKYPPGAVRKVLTDMLGITEAESDFAALEALITA